MAPGGNRNDPSYAQLLRENAELRKELEESRHAQQEMEKVHQRLHAVVEHAPVVVFTTDRDGIFTLSEGRGLQLLGLKPGQVVGLSVFDVYRDFPKICTDLRACLRGELIIALVPVNGLIWESMYVPKLGPDGDVVGVSGVAWDVTARVRAEENARTLEQRLREAQKLEMMGTLAGGIAHDFNNILAPVMGYSELALMSMPANHAARADVEQIRNAARRARDLVQQILIFSRRSDQTKHPIQIHLVIEEALQLIHSAVPANVEIVLHIEARGDLVLADASQLHQVVMNLVLNAIHAMRNTGGTLRVELSRRVLDEQAAFSAGIARGPYLQLAVVDQGEGMTEETLARAFEPFFTTKRASGGTGLGLAVVDGIVHSHGGVIEASSVEGKGSTFRVLLPAAAEETSARTQDVLVATPRGSGRVLVVDDEPSIVSLLHRFLESHGYQVTGFTSGEQALAQFRRTPDAFDVVITDKAMPRMNGVELAAALREARPGLPVLLITGYVDAVERREMSQDIVGVIAKPFEGGAALRAVHDAMRRAHGGDQIN